jgi:glycerol kinase
VGLSRAATKAHLARASLEAICYQTRDVLDAMSADSKVALTEIRVDGGITANELCMQMQADILGVEVIRPVIIETTALGAAYAAGLATGFYKDTSELKAKWREDRRFMPDKTSALATTGFKNWKKAIEKTLNWLD